MVSVQTHKTGTKIWNVYCKSVSTSELNFIVSIKNAPSLKQRTAKYSTFFSFVKLTFSFSSVKTVQNENKMILINIKANDSSNASLRRLEPLPLLPNQSQNMFQDFGLQACVGKFQLKEKLFYSW